MRFDVGCELTYEVHSAATVLFNIQAAQLDQQRVLSEKLVLTPDIAYETRSFRDPGCWV